MAKKINSDEIINQISPSDNTNTENIWNFCLEYQSCIICKNKLLDKSPKACIKCFNIYCNECYNKLPTTNNNKIKCTICSKNINKCEQINYELLLKKLNADIEQSTEQQFINNNFCDDHMNELKQQCNTCNQSKCIDCLVNICKKHDAFDINSIQMNKYNELQKHLNVAKNIEVQLFEEYKETEDQIIFEKMDNYDQNLSIIKSLKTKILFEIDQKYYTTDINNSKVDFNYQNNTLSNLKNKINQCNKLNYIENYDAYINEIGKLEKLNYSDQKQATKEIDINFNKYVTEHVIDLKNISKNYNNRTKLKLNQLFYPLELHLSANINSKIPENNYIIIKIDNNWGSFDKQVNNGNNHILSAEQKHKLIEESQFNIEINLFNYVTNTFELLKSFNIQGMFGFHYMLFEETCYLNQLKNNNLINNKSIMKMKILIQHTNDIINNIKDEIGLNNIKKLSGQDDVIQQLNLNNENLNQKIENLTNKLLNKENLNNIKNNEVFKLSKENSINEQYNSGDNKLINQNKT